MTNALPDHYQTLGVKPNATEREIKAAYRRLAKKHHPDLSDLPDSEAEALFRSINEAWEVLGDPDQRQKYDNLRRTTCSDTSAKRARTNSDTSARRAGTDPGVSDDPFPDFSKLGINSFEELVEYKLRQHQSDASAPPHAPDSHTGPPQVVVLHLSYSEAYFGIERTLTIDGRAVRVRIPPGVSDGSTLRLTGSHQGVPLCVKLKPHPYFQIVGGDLVLRLPITPEQARLGTQICIPYPKGTLTLTVPRGTKDGQSLRCRGKGWPKKGGDYTDLKVHISVSSSAEADVKRTQQGILKVGF
jgi:curved DNA-binding protein